MRGRTYAVPFATVWSHALRLANGDMPGMRLLSADELAGQIVAEATGPVLAMPSEFTVAIALDANAQTRVDLRSVSETARADLGFNARRIANFTRLLDRAVGHGRS
jgi:hypothetical protein